MFVHFDLVIDEQDFAIFANIECRATGDLTFGVIDPVRLGDGSVRIAQYWVIGFQAFREFLVFLGRINAGGEIGDVKFLDGLAVST